MRVCFNCEREARVVINNLHPPFHAKGLCDAKGPCIDRWYREFATINDKPKKAAA